MKKDEAILLLASGESSADIRYATGLNTPDNFIAFVINGQSYAILSPLEYDRARKSDNKTCLVLRDSDFNGPDKLEVIKTVADKFDLNQFTVPADFPLLWADRLRENGFRVIPAANAIFPQREFKTSREAELIREAEKAACSALCRAVEIIGESSIGKHREIIWQNAPLTSEILRGEIDCQLIRCGMFPTGTICAGGSQSAQPHNAGSGILYAYTPIVMDIFPKSMDSGYWGDLTRTVVKGKAPDIVKKAHTAVCEAKYAAISEIAVGKSPADLHTLAERILASHGFTTGVGDSGDYGFFHSLGHGVGLEIHEEPRISYRNTSPLQGGEIITIEPGLYYPEWGGIRQEDLLYISSGGDVQNFTTLPDTLEVP